MTVSGDFQFGLHGSSFKAVQPTLCIAPIFLVCLYHVPVRQKVAAQAVSCEVAVSLRAPSQVCGSAHEGRAVGRSLSVSHFCDLLAELRDGGCLP